LLNNSVLENEMHIKTISDNSLLSDSSDNHTDYSSETSSFKKKNFDTRYPKFIKSKSFILKKTMSDTIKNIVEELNEDGEEVEIPKKTFVIDHCHEDLESKFRKHKPHKSFRETNLMDTLYEVKEEQNPEITIEKKTIKLQSPQMKFLTDNLEDTTIKHFFSSNNMGSYKFDQEDVITEDNNENNLENVELKKSTSNKKLETFIDKSESFDDQMNVKKNITETLIETIKEENVEEEEKEDISATANFNQKSCSCEFPISDELPQGTGRKLKYRLSMKKNSVSFEEENKVIKEVDDEL